MKARATVVSLGLHSPLGLDALSTAMLYRAGVAGMATAPILDAEGEPITMCYIPTLDPQLVGWERIVAVAKPALAEVLASVAGRIEGRLGRFVLCIDERYGRATDRSDGRDQAAAFTAGIHDELGRRFPEAQLEVIARGAASAAWGLSAAIADLEGGRCEAVLLGSVHSDYEPAWIQELSQRGRLFRPDNLDSFIPGELAAFVLLTRADTARRLNLDPLAVVSAVATGRELATPDNDHSAYEARGLTDTIRAATSEMVAEGLTAGWAINDVTFEQRQVHEWQAMLIRTRKAWAEPYVVESPAQRMGQLGAAAIPLGISLAALGWQTGAAPAPRAVVYAGSDGGERGAVLLTAGS